MRVCDKEQLFALAEKLARELEAGDRVFLEGELGAGKSTFAQALLAALGATPDYQGSPTFSLVHDYRSESKFELIRHMDLYRLKSESDLEMAGLLEDLSGRQTVLVLCEWLSQFPDLEKALMFRTDARWIRVELAFVPGNLHCRSIELSANFDLKGRWDAISK